MTIITRVGYCIECAKAKRPKKGQLFLAIGSREISQAYTSMRDGKSGYTPHLFGVNKVVGKYVFFQSVCCMEGCGSYSEESDITIFLHLDESKWSEPKLMSVKDWNALCDYKDETYWI